MSVIRATMHTYRAIGMQTYTYTYTYAYTEVQEHVVEYSRELVATIGDEVERLEGIIVKELPEMRHVDLEIL